MNNLVKINIQLKLLFKGIILFNNAWWWKSGGGIQNDNTLNKIIIEDSSQISNDMDDEIPF